MQSIQTLNSNTFQDFCSSMLIELFGISVYPGGRGKDGGRDAIFEGKLKIPSTEGSINGKWIIQVKFYEKDLTTQKTWLKKPLVDLKKEVKKFQGKEHNFDSYLLITNVPLTWVEQTGTFDQINDKVVAEYKSAGFLNFQIFDENRIKAFFPLIHLTTNFFLEKNKSSKLKSPCHSLIKKPISLICDKINNSIFEFNKNKHPHFSSIISWNYKGKRFYLFKATEYEQVPIIIEAYNRIFQNEIIVVYGALNYLNILKGKINYLGIPSDTIDFNERIINYQNYMDNPIE